MDINPSHYMGDVTIRAKTILHVVCPVPKNGGALDAAMYLKYP